MIQEVLSAREINSAAEDNLHNIQKSAKVETNYISGLNKARKLFSVVINPSVHGQISSDSSPKLKNMPENTKWLHAH